MLANVLQPIFQCAGLIITSTAAKSAPCNRSVELVGWKVIESLAHGLLMSVNYPGNGKLLTIIFFFGNPLGNQPWWILPCWPEGIFKSCNHGFSQWGILGPQTIRTRSTANAVSGGAQSQSRLSLLDAQQKIFGPWRLHWLYCYIYGYDTWKIFARSPSMVCYPSECLGEGN